VSSQETVLLIL